MFKISNILKIKRDEFRKEFHDWDITDSEFRYANSNQDKCCTSKCDDSTWCVIQSEEEVMPHKADESSGGITDFQTVSFVDQTTGLKIGAASSHDDVILHDAADAASLGDFLSRPVVISTQTWAQTDAVGVLATFNPWRQFLSNSIIAKKISNFAFIRGNLKVKVLVNASPFYYGAMYLAYQPLQNFCPSTIINDAGTRYLIPYSQRPGVWIRPQDSEGGEITLPFFYPKNYLRLGYLQDTIDMGEFKYVIYSALQSANGATGAGVTIQVLAWMEDAVLSGPTVDVQLQGDEYTPSGQISGPASTVGRIAGMLSGVPIIGKFAKATEIGANAVSGIASLFGYTNVPNIKDAEPVKLMPMPQFASPEIGYPTEKLTLDPKNELSIDPTITGLPDNEDELSIEHLATKESYLCTTTWATTDSANKILFTTRINPTMYDYENIANNSKIYSTPLGWVSNCFRNWRGDIILRFKVVRSQYHKGRLLISYDPAGKSANSLLNTTGTTQSVFSRVIDIGEEEDVEIRIPYQQALPFLNVPNVVSATNIPWSTSASPTWSGDDTQDNGVLTVRVFNALTAPVATSNVKVLVYVRAAENFELANPINVGTSFTPFAIQSEEETKTAGTSRDESYTTQMVAGKSLPIMTPERNLVNFGEVVRSLRPLLRRMALTEVVYDSSDSGFSNSLTLLEQTKFPMYFGYDPAGVHSAKGLVATASNFNFNYVYNTVYNWIAPAFVGQRGSYIWTVNTDAPDAIKNVQCIRTNAISVTANETNFSQAGGTPSGNARFYFNLIDATNGGTAATSQLTNAGLTVLMPNYTQYKFMTTRPQSVNAPTSTTTDAYYDGGNRDGYRWWISHYDGALGTSQRATKIWRYAGCGTDFNLHFFLNVPVFYNITATPPSN